MLVARESARSVRLAQLQLRVTSCPHVFRSIIQSPFNLYLMLPFVQVRMVRVYQKLAMPKVAIPMGNMMINYWMWGYATKSFRPIMLYVCDIYIHTHDISHNMYKYL